MLLGPVGLAIFGLVVSVPEFKIFGMLVDILIERDVFVAQATEFAEIL